MSGKLPWFRFWAAEFSRRTRCLKPNEVGFLVRLEIAIYENGGAIEDDITFLKRLGGVEKKTAEGILERLIASGLIQRRAGVIWSSFIAAELEHQGERSEKYRKNAAGRGRNASKNNDAPEQLHLENRDGDLEGGFAPRNVAALRSTEEGIALERDPAQRPAQNLAGTSGGNEVDLPGIGPCLIEAVDRSGYVWARSLSTGKTFGAFRDGLSWSRIEECDPDDLPIENDFPHVSYGAR